MENDYFSLSWNNFQNTLTSGFKSLLEDEDLVDVTLAADGKYIKAHKTVLSICSTFFKKLFQANPCNHPIIVIPNVSYNILCNLLTFMYHGEVSVSQEEISSLISIAELLQIKGLTDYNNSQTKKLNLTEEETAIEPKEEPLDNSEKIEDCSVDYEDYPLKKSPDFVDVLSFENNENLSISEETSSCSLLPDKSRDKYLKEYNLFKEYCEQNNIKKIDEYVILEYLKEKSKVLKSPSLWSKYSALKATLAVQDNLQLQFPRVLAFLRRHSAHHIAKQPETFTRDDINKFLIEAPDHTYLMMKVVLIMGVLGGCRTIELTNINLDDIEDEGTYLRVKIRNPATKDQRTFFVTNQTSSGLNLVDIYRKYVNLRTPKTEHRRLFVFYKDGKCSSQCVGKNTLGIIPRRIAKFLKKTKVEDYTGHCLRRTSSVLLQERATII